jgi:hypothetical protein
MRTEMDYLVMGGYLLDKQLQAKVGQEENWKEYFELD